MMTATKIDASTPPPAPAFTVKNARSCKGNEGIAYSATIYYEGKRFAELMNDGNGGSTVYHLVDRGRFHESKPVRDLVDWIRTKPAYLAEYLGENVDLNERWHVEHAVDAYFSWLLDRIDEDKALRRLCKTKVLFRVRGDRQGEWHTMRADWKTKETEIRAYLAKNYGDRIIEIANERFT